MVGTIQSFCNKILYDLVQRFHYRKNCNNINRQKITNYWPKHGLCCPCSDTEVLTTKRVDCSSQLKLDSDRRVNSKQVLEYKAITVTFNKKNIVGVKRLIFIINTCLTFAPNLENPVQHFSDVSDPHHQMCWSCAMLSSLYGPLSNISSTLLSPCQEGLCQFWKQKDDSIQD